VELSANNFSAHEELARLAENRDDFPLASEHYQKAWELRPELRYLLLDLGRVWKALKLVEDANAALLATSRGAEPRAAEKARELLPERYPYVYEFQRAISIDPKNVPLRRELAYLHLAMGEKAGAENEFRRIVELAPDDLLSAAQLGFLMLNRNEHEGAMPLLQRALTSDDDELTDRIRTALRLPQALKKRPGDAALEGLR
jgi:tetratricopeptide (TPR) repeat protein